MTGTNGAPVGDPFQPHLLWGLKASFVEYISSLPDGRIDASEGVWQVRNNFAFPVSEQPNMPETELHFMGSVCFVGHGSMMKLDLVDPHLEEHGEKILLSVADQSATRRPLAELSEVDVITIFGIVKTIFEARLTEEGSALFNGQYKAGQILEPVVIMLRG